MLEARRRLAIGDGDGDVFRPGGGVERRFRGNGAGKGPLVGTFEYGSGLGY